MLGAQIVEQPWFLKQKVFAIANRCPDTDACAMRFMHLRLHRKQLIPASEIELKLT